MRLHLAGIETSSANVEVVFKLKPPYLLGSYYYLNRMSKQELATYFNYIQSSDCKGFILDSGAFTHMESSKKNREKFKENIMQYVDGYVAFIKKWGCKYYIELDVDTILGYTEVKKVTAYIEKKVGYRSMPVFHGGYRSKEDLDDILERYDYMCVSNSTQSKTTSLYKYLKAVVVYAKKRGVKVHGLALTGKRLTSEIPEFYSIDSSSWSRPQRYGLIPLYDEKINRIRDMRTKTNKRLDLSPEGTKKIVLHSIGEWLKYVRYLDRRICL